MADGKHALVILRILSTYQSCTRVQSFPFWTFFLASAPRQVRASVTQRTRCAAAGSDSRTSPQPPPTPARLPPERHVSQTGVSGELRGAAQRHSNQRVIRHLVPLRRHRKQMRRPRSVFAVRAKAKRKSRRCSLHISPYFQLCFLWLGGRNHKFCMCWKRYISKQVDF